MPIIPYRCEKCKKTLDLVQLGNTLVPNCCGMPMKRVITYPAMIKIKGSGGYPSRRKFLNGSAPNTTRVTKSWGSYDPNDSSVKPMG